MEEARKRLAEILDINEPTEFFKTVDKKRDDLLDDAEDTAPVFDFFKGDQKKIFEEAVKNLAYFGNSKTYVSDQELLKVVEEIETIVKDSKPFGKIQRLPELNKRFEELHMGLLEKEAAIIDPLVHDDFLKVKASMVFVGNINQSVETLQKTSSLFDPFPPEMGTDTAFLDRFHAYIPGWEIPKYRPDSFTNDYGFITDYLSEFMRELRKDNYSNIAEKYFKLGNNLNQRDAIAVRKLISGFIKLIYPDGEVSKEEVAEIMDISLELRRRVKEQLKKIGGMEFYDVNFSYIDNDSFDEHFVSVPEQGGGKMIPEGMGKPGCLYTVSKSKTGMIGCYRLETQMMPGNGKLTCTGIGSGKEPKEATNTAFNYLKANGNAISGNISTTTKDYIINYQDMQGLGMTGNLALPTLIAISSAALSKPPISSLAVLGEISIGGTLIKVEDLASTLQVCLDSGAKKVLLPITSAADLGTVPSDLVGAFSLIFYSSPEEAVYKALGVE